MAKEEEKAQSYEYKETRVSKWVFRAIAVVLIVASCCLAIHLEFNAMKKNDTIRADAMQMIGHLSKTSENFSDAWKTIYFFYKAGDLFRILRCPDANFKTGIRQHNTLLDFYRERIEHVEGDDDDNFDKSVYKIRCGEKVTIDVGLKNELYKHPNDYQSYTFKLGEEPIEIIEKYPFIKHALNRMHFGERATFVAIPTENNVLRPRKHSMYEITVHLKFDKRPTLPLYSIIKNKNDAMDVDQCITCGNVVSFLYAIYDASGKLLKTDKKVQKVRVGSGELHLGMEQLMTQMSVGDRYKIFISKDNYKPNAIIGNDLFKDRSIIVFDIMITRVQR